MKLQQHAFITSFFVLLLLAVSQRDVIALTRAGQVEKSTTKVPVTTQWHTVLHHKAVERRGAGQRYTAHQSSTPVSPEDFPRVLWSQKANAGLNFVR